MLFRTLLFFCVAGSLAAQTASLSVRTLAMTNGKLPEVFLKTKDDHTSVRFSHIQPSRPIRVRFANPLPLYESKIDENGNPGFAVSQTVKLPTSASRILLLAWTDGERTRYFSIKDDIGSASSSDWLLVNASRNQLFMQIGQDSKPFAIAPGATQRQRITVEKDKGAAIGVSTTIKGKMKKFYSTYWPVYRDKRTLVLFVPSGDKIRVKRISDKIGQEEEEEDS